MTIVEGKPAIILLAEDDRGDQELTRRALEGGTVENEIHIVENGEEALDYLLRKGSYKDPKNSPRPDLILLDLNMPKVNGWQVLEEMKHYDELRRLVVVVLTTSARKEDVERGYDLGANSFITKSADMNKFIRAIRSLKEYWFQTVVLP